MECFHHGREYGSIIFLSLLTVSLLLPCCECQKEVCGLAARNTVDVMWVIDTSGDVDSSNFRVLKQFLSGMMQWFRITSDDIYGTRHGCLVYNDSVDLVSSYVSSMQTAQENFIGLKQTNKVGKELDKVFDYLANTEVDFDRPTVPNVAVIIDGSDLSAKDISTTAAKLLEADWTIIFVDVTAKNVNSDEIQTISSEPNIEKRHYHVVTSFNKLNSLELQEQLARAICKHNYNNGAQPKVRLKRNIMSINRENSVFACDFEYDGMCQLNQDPKENVNATGTYDWLHYDNSTAEQGVGNSSGYMYVDMGSPSEIGDEARVATRNLDFVGAVCLSFWYRFLGQSAGVLRAFRVDTLQYPTHGHFANDFFHFMQVNFSTRMTVWEVSGNQSDEWRHARVEVKLLNISNGIGFTGVKGSDADGAIAIDNIEVLRAGCIPRGYYNVALNKLAEQLTAYQDFYAHNAVDGSTDPSIWSCSLNDKTALAPNWWMVDLGEPYNISYVGIFNTDDETYRASLNEIDVYLVINYYGTYRGALEGAVDCGGNNKREGYIYAQLVKCPKSAIAYRYVTVKHHRVFADRYLSLCELQVWTDCQAGTYGLYCKESCPANCHMGICNNVTGDCSACKAGFQGVKCAEPCSANCDGLCEQDTGECLQCIAGKTGTMCDLDCPRHCDNNICFQSSGLCVGCIIGKTGDRCDLNCPDDKYGAACANTCPPNCQGACNLISGVCNSCKAGYQGKTCETVSQVQESDNPGFDNDVESAKDSSKNTLVTGVGVVLVIIVVVGSLIGAVYLWRRSYRMIREVPRAMMHRRPTVIRGLHK